MLLYQLKQKSILKVSTFIPSDSNAIIWAHYETRDLARLQKMLVTLDVHPLAHKAMLGAAHAPRLDIYKKEAYIAAFTIKEDFSPLKINILVGKNHVLTYAEDSETDLFRQIENDFLNHPDHMADTGHILYHIIDKISMFYLKIVDKLSNEVQKVEKEVFKKPFSNQIGHSIYNWKGKIHNLRQIVEAYENVITSIARSKLTYINEESGFYFEDLVKHFERVTEAFDTFKEDLSSIFDLQMSLKSDHLNAVMKTLTLVSVIFIPMTFIAGVYGMNFEKMPELKWDIGYYYSLTLMIGLGTAIALYFKKKGWWGDNKQ